MGGRLITSVFKELQARFESLEGYIKADRSAAEDRVRQNVSLEKRCRSAEESRSKLKSKDEA